MAVVEDLDVEIAPEWLGTDYLERRVVNPELDARLPHLGPDQLLGGDMGGAGWRSGPERQALSFAGVHAVGPEREARAFQRPPGRR